MNSYFNCREASPEYKNYGLIDFIRPEFFQLFYNGVKKIATADPKKILNSFVLDIGHTYQKAIQRARNHFLKQGESGEARAKGCKVVISLFLCYTPARTQSISGQKSVILKLTFLT